MVKRTIYFTVSLLYILACSLKSYNKEGTNNSIEPFSILSIESNLVEIKYVIIGYTKSIPPHVFKKEDSYIYEILVKLALNTKSESFNDPLYMLIESLNNKVQPLKYDDQLTQIANGLFPEYTAKCEVKGKGDIQIILGNTVVDGEIIFDKNNPFRTRIIKLE